VLGAHAWAGHTPTFWSKNYSMGSRIFAGLILS
jgi:hypothetical protein